MLSLAASPSFAGEGLATSNASLPHSNLLSIANFSKGKAAGIQSGDPWGRQLLRDANDFPPSVCLCFSEVVFRCEANAKDGICNLLMKTEK